MLKHYKKNKVLDFGGLSTSRLGLFYMKKPKCIVNDMAWEHLTF